MKTRLLLLTFLFSFVVNAQDGTLDTSFGTNGMIDYSALFSEFVDMKTDYYSKVVALGKNSDGIPILVRFNQDGSLDTTFDEDGIKVIDFGNEDETPASFCIFDNSTGWGYLVASSMSGKIARILNDGSFAPTFGTNGIYAYNESTHSTYPAFVEYDWANYKIVVFSANGTDISASGGSLYRINPVGTPDTTFNNGNPVSFYFYTGYTIIPNGISTDDDGNIYASGYWLVNNQPYVAKFSTTGIWDNSYTLSGNLIDTSGYFFNGIDNTSYVYGSSWQSAVNRMTIRKHTPTGSSDTSFGTDGSAYIEVPGEPYYANVKSIALSYSGEDYEVSKIILAGRTREQSSSSMASITVTAINPDGSLDTSFGTNGFTTVPTNLSSYTLPVASAVDYETGKLYVMGVTGAGASGRAEAVSAETKTISFYRLNFDSMLSVQEQSVEKSIQIFPNPVSETLNFSEELSNIQLFDITGRTIKSYDGISDKIDVSTLSNGNYILKGETESGEQFSIKFIKN